LAQSGDKGTLYIPRTPIWTKPNTWLEPDLFYISANTLARINKEQLTTADLVIEITSPGSAIYDRNTKADTYAALGVTELWLVDESSAVIEVRVLEGDRYGSSVTFESGDLLRSTVLPDLEFKAGKIFDD
jgi:Uma2 family endonuclease